VRQGGPLQAGGKSVLPRTLRISGNGTINYRKRKIQMGSNNAGQAVQIVEDNGLVTIYLGNTKARGLLLGPTGTYHSNSSPSSLQSSPVACNSCRRGRRT